MILSLLACVIVDTGPESVDEHSLILEEDVTAVLFDVGAGDVSVQVGDVATVEVTRIARYTGDPPTVSDDIVNGELVLTSRCGEMEWHCSVDHVVTVPAGTHVAGGTGSGDVDLLDLDAGAEFETGSGDVTLECVAGDVEIGTGSGDVTGLCVSAGTTFVSTGSGDVDLELTGAVELVVVDTGSGSVSLRVPSGAYAVDVNTGSGDIAYDGIELDSGAEARIEVDTGSGDVQIVGL